MRKLLILILAFGAVMLVGCAIPMKSTTTTDVVEYYHPSAAPDEAAKVAGQFLPVHDKG